MGRRDSGGTLSRAAARDAILVDTGFLVALFDTRAPLHAAARDWLVRVREPLWTVPSVWVEAAYFLPGRLRVER